MDTDTTPGLISACLQGDEIAIERLVHQHEAGVFKLALSVLDDPLEANEAAQDAFIAALAALGRYQDNSTFKAWLYTITLNTCRSRLRKRKTLDKLRLTLTSIFQVQTQKLPTPEDAVIQNEKDAALWQALKNMDEKHRLPLVLRYFHELPIAEIAQILNLNEGTVHSRLFTGRDRLRALLEMQHDLTGE
jgi:RNA polymerase sigma-70 factor, ECF subfamily